MKRGATVYLYELAWILPSVAIPVGMLAALLVTAFGAGIHLPGREGRVDPTRVSETPPFDRPGVVELGPGRYEVHMVAQIWTFTPNEIRIPAGSTVTFVATSKDVVHGFLIHGRSLADTAERAPETRLADGRAAPNVNVMLLPGQVARVTARFDRPGEYPFLCHEYCGIAHHTMWGKVIVEARP